MDKFVKNIRNKQEKAKKAEAKAREKAREKAKSKYFNTECPICLDNPTDDQLVVKFSCNHFICKECKELYPFCCDNNCYNLLTSCPLCRRDISKMEMYVYGSDKIIKVLKYTKYNSDDEFEDGLRLLEMIRN